MGNGCELVCLMAVRVVVRGTLLLRGGATSGEEVNVGVGGRGAGEVGGAHAWGHRGSGSRGEASCSNGELGGGNEQHVGNGEMNVEEEGGGEVKCIGVGDCIGVEGTVGEDGGASRGWW